MQTTFKSGGKFVWGDKVITPDNTVGEVAAVCYDGTYEVQKSDGKLYNYSEEELVIAWR